MDVGIFKNLFRVFTAYDMMAAGARINFLQCIILDIVPPAGIKFTFIHIIFIYSNLSQLNLFIKIQF